MKRRLTAAALALIFPLSMAACGSQSTADACKEIATARTSPFTSTRPNTRF